MERFQIEICANSAISALRAQEGGANRTKFTRIGIGQNTLYDKIKYDDGRIGYMLKKWIYEYKYSKVESVSLNTTYSDLSVGEKLQLTANINPSDAENKEVTWSSSDNNIATVNSDGLVEAKNRGVATITVTTQDGNKTARMTVTVAKKVIIVIGSRRMHFKIVQI